MELDVQRSSVQLQWPVRLLGLLNMIIFIPQNSYVERNFLNILTFKIADIIKDLSIQMIFWQ